MDEGYVVERIIGKRLSAKGKVESMQEGSSTWSSGKVTRSRSRLGSPSSISPMWLTSSKSTRSSSKRRPKRSPFKRKRRCRPNLSRTTTQSHKRVKTESRSQTQNQSLSPSPKNHYKFPPNPHVLVSLLLLKATTKNPSTSATLNKK